MIGTSISWATVLRDATDDDLSDLILAEFTKDR